MWSCAKCDTLNDEQVAACAFCMTPRPSSTPELLTVVPTVSPEFSPAAPSVPPTLSMIPPTVPPIPYTQMPPSENMPALDAGTVGRAFSVGWEAFSRQMGMAILGFVVFYFINLAGNMIPYLSILFGLFVVPVLAGGMIFFFLNLVQGKKAEIGDLFSGFSNYGKWIGLLGLWVAVGLVIALPLLIAALIFFLPHLAAGMNAMGMAIEAQLPLFITLLLVSGLISLALYCTAITRWGLAYYAAADGADALEAFSISAAITEGRRWQTLGVLLLFGLIAGAGVIGCCVGFLFTAPFAQCAMATYYRDLKALHGTSNSYPRF